MIQDSLLDRRTRGGGFYVAGENILHTFTSHELKTGNECFFNFRCYTVHVVEFFNYYTNHCTYIKFIKFTH